MHDKERNSKFNKISEEGCLVARCSVRQIGLQEQFVCNRQTGVSAAPADVENTPGDDVSFRWRQNVVNVKVFLRVVGNDQREPPGDPPEHGCGGEGGGGGEGGARQRVGSAMSIWTR